MDRISPSEGDGPGSIPGEGTTLSVVLVALSAALIKFTLLNNTI